MHMKANKGRYWALGEAVSWIHTRDERRVTGIKTPAVVPESLRAIEELVERCRADRVRAIGRRCMWPHPSFKYSLDAKEQMQWATAVFSGGHPNDTIEIIPAVEWNGLELDFEDVEMNSWRSMHSQHRVWTTVHFSQADVKREWPSSSIRRRGPRPDRFDQAVKAMRDEIAQKRLTPVQLQGMKGKELADRYKVSRTTATAARKAVLKKLDPAEK
jgi:hypothetical protein